MQPVSEASPSESANRPALYLKILLRGFVLRPHLARRHLDRRSIQFLLHASISAADNAKYLASGLCIISALTELSGSII